MTLKEFFLNNKKLALAYSGGVDSSYLLYLTKKYNVDVTAYFVKTEFQPYFVMKDSIQFAQSIDANLKIIADNILDNVSIINNDDNRCYYCKKHIMELIINSAKEDGYDLIIDGTNFSDDEFDLPGFKALNEMNIISPLRICKLTQNDVRKLSKEEGLSIWNKFSYSCLATRICKNQRITKRLLSNIEKSETYLSDLGLKDFELSVSEKTAVIKVKREDFNKVINYRDKIVITMSHMFDNIYLDLKRKK